MTRVHPRKQLDLAVGSLTCLVREGASQVDDLHHAIDSGEFRGEDPFLAALPKRLNLGHAERGKGVFEQVIDVWRRHCVLPVGSCARPYRARRRPRPGVRRRRGSQLHPSIRRRFVVQATQLVLPETAP